MAMIYSTHGDIPKIVMTPSTVEEAFYDTVEAFNLAEEYQCPVILVTDLALSLGKQTVEPLDYNRVEIRRGALKLGEELPERIDGTYYKRYEVTDSGVSNRVIPGMKNGIHHVTGVEHDETGKPSESPENRIAQMDKRLRKLADLPNTFKNPLHVHAEHQEADILVVGVNSTRGTIEEAMPRLEADGIKVNHAQIRLLHPFPADALKQQIAKAKKVIVVENNATAQLANIIKMNVGDVQIEHVLKYDGNPFLPGELHQICKKKVEASKELV